MPGTFGKTDKPCPERSRRIDAKCLATLLYLGKLPCVWIPSGDLRDERELPRTRTPVPVSYGMTFSQHRTRVKNRIHSTLAKYALSIDTNSDIFAPKWRTALEDALAQLPEETGRCAHQQLQILDTLNTHIRLLEDRIMECIHMSPSIQLIQTIPGPAKVLTIVIDHELGSIDRFPSPKHFTSYCGLVPKVSSSAGRTHYGRMVKQCYNYLKWAFCEASRVKGGTSKRLM